MKKLNPETTTKKIIERYKVNTQFMAESAKKVTPIRAKLDFSNKKIDEKLSYITG